MKKVKTKVLAWTMCVLMAMTLVPQTLVFADETPAVETVNVSNIDSSADSLTGDAGDIMFAVEEDVTDGNVNEDTKEDSIDEGNAEEIIESEGESESMSVNVKAANADAVLSSEDDASDEKSAAVAQIDDVLYETLAEAIAAAADGDTVTLLADASGDGIFLGSAQAKNITIDLGGHTYDVSGQAVGSSGTETQGWHLEEGNTVTIKNGTLTATSPSVKMFIQNYCDLTLTDVTVDGTGSRIQYVVSNNSGNVRIDGATSIEAGEGQIALDSCKFGSYEAPHVTIETTGTITGDIECTGGKLAVKAGTVEGAIVTDQHYTAGDVEISGGTFTGEISEEYCAEGFTPVLVDGTYTVKAVTAAAQIGDVLYETLAEAIAAAADGDTVKLLADASGDGIFLGSAQAKNITIDLGGHTYDVSGQAVGSSGTETQGWHLEEGNTVTIKNGTLTATSPSVKMFIQNYCDLTLTDVTVDGTGSRIQYVVSNNSGNVRIDGATSIEAEEGNIALDSCKFGSYEAPHVTIDTTGTITGDIECTGGKLAVKAGTVEGEIVTDQHYTAGDIEISGGTFTGEISEEYCAEGFTPVLVDGTYTVKAVTYAAQIGEERYETLAEAIAAAETGDTVKLLADASGDGIFLGSAQAKNITIDLGGHTYDVSGQAVGSSGTETQGWHLEEGSTVTIKNGTLTATSPSVKMFIQNYCDLTLTDVTVDGTGSRIQYVVSNNSGNVRIDGATSIEAGEGNIALDSCKFGSYEAPHVTIDTTGSIGTVELSGGKLEVANGDIEKIVTASGYAEGDSSVRGGTSDVKLDEEFLAEGYHCVASGDRYKVEEHTEEVIPAVAPTFDSVGYTEGIRCSVCGEIIVEPTEIAKLTAAAQIGEERYETLAEAIAAAETGDTVKLLADASGDGIFLGSAQAKNITIDLGGHTYDVSGQAVGSSGTETQGWHLEEGSTVTIKNGTLTATSASVKMFIQNYCDLTLTDVTVDGTGSRIQYVVSNNSGNVRIDGATSIEAGEGNIALDSCKFGSYEAPHVTIDTTGSIGTVELSGGKLEVANGDIEKIVTASGYAEGDSSVRGGTSDVKLDEEFLAEGYHCVASGDRYKVEEHTEEVIPAVAPTFDSVGYTEGIRCSVCGEIIVEPTEIAKLTAAAQIGEERYETLAEAIAAAETGDVVTLLADASGDGIFLGSAQAKSITIDLGGHTYDVSGQAVGSSGTETQGWHLEEGNTVTIKNGTLTATSPSVKMFIQNYCDLTLTDVTVDGTGSRIQYVVSNNSGNVRIDGATSIEAGEGNIALDSCKFGSYEAPHVTIDTTGSIGTVELSGGKLEVANGDIEKIVTASGYAEGDSSVRGGTSDVKLDEEFLAEGYHCVASGDRYKVEEHTEEIIPAVEPTCTETGLTEEIKCSVCDEIIKAQEVVPAKGHTEETIPAVAPTFDSVGYTEGIRCSVCGEIIVEPTEIAKLAAAAQIGEERYETLAEAIAAAETGDVVTLLADASGDGIFLGSAQAKNITIDLGGHTYDVSGQAVGSSGTETQGWHLEEGNTVTIKNGTLTATSPSVKMFIQNYCDLTLTDVTVDGTGSRIQYVVSNNSGNVRIDGATSIEAGEGNIALDSCKFGSYEAPHVTIDTTGSIGTVELSGGKLEVANGDIEKIVTASGYAEGDSSVRGGTSDVKLDEEFLAEGYHCVASGDRYKVEEHTEEIIPAVAPTFDSVGYTEGIRCSVCGEIIVEPTEIAKLTAAAQIGEERYETLAEAIAAAADGDTVTLLADASGDGIFLGSAQAKNITIDLGGHTYDVSGQAVGSSGTETQGWHLEEGNTVTIKNGTLTATSASVKMFIQNYCDLTLTDVTVDGTGSRIQYVVSNNSGNVRIDGATSIEAGEGNIALDSCKFGSYEAPHVTIDTTGSIGTVELSGGKLEVANGDIEKIVTASGYAEGDSSVRGGTSDVKLDEEFLAEGYHCVASGDRYKVEEHTEEVIPAVEPTCTETGLTEGIKCSVCDEIIKAQEVIPAKGHTEEIIPAVEATCTETGLTEGIKCSECGKIIKAQEVIPAKGHTYEVLERVEPTCTETGLTTGVKCSECGEVLLAQEVIPAKGHTEEIIPAVEATCTETGLTEGIKCSVCDEIIKAQEVIPAKGHTEEIIPAVEPTCTEPGLTEGTKCSECGKIIKAQEVIPAKGHTEEIIPAVEATCTETGLTEGIKCSDCGEIIKAQEVIPAKGHTYEVLERVEPTCTETGLTTGVKCSECGEVLLAQEVIPAKGHTEEIIPAVEPTCTEPGLTEGTKCLECGKIIKAQEVIPAKGHTEEIIPAVEPTCTEPGLTEGIKCSECGKIIKAQEVIEALGHKWDNGVITKQPSITEEGIRTYTCERCHETRTETIAKLTLTGRFTDIDDCGDTAKSAIIWAADQGIVNGYSGARTGMFGPTDNCTRQQMMIMLWRAAGCPEPESVESAEVFYDSNLFGESGKLAIAWGVENAIVGGYTDASGMFFDPNGTVTRAQTVVMMWRMAGRPEPKSTSTAFTDIENQSAGVKIAIYWAAENAITQGSLQSDGTYKFNPTDSCQRQHIAIFVYRLIPILGNN